MEYNRKDMVRENVIRLVHLVDNRLDYILDRLHEYEDDENARALTHYYDGQIHILRDIRDELEGLEVLTRP